MGVYPICDYVNCMKTIQNSIETESTGLKTLT